MLQPGSVFAGRFEIRALAGSGGMGEVYRALDQKAQAPVALKLLEPGGEALDASRFGREAEALSGLAPDGDRPVEELLREALRSVGR